MERAALVPPLAPPAWPTSKPSGGKGCESQGLGWFSPRCFLKSRSTSGWGHSLPPWRIPPLEMGTLPGRGWKGTLGSMWGNSGQGRQGM